jgi:hypothetical protein
MAWRRPQSHSRQLRHTANTPAGREDLVKSGTPAWYARRALLRAAVFDSRDHGPWAHQPTIATSVLTGVVADVREEVIVLNTDRGTETFAISPATVTWLGATTAPSALRAGDRAVIRYQAGDTEPRAPRLAERIWARIGRVAGTIIAADGREFLVAAGRADRPPQRVVLAAASARQIQVRFPRLAPGYLLDVIGTRHGDHLLAVAPATAQPPYRAGHAPTPPLVDGPLPVPISGSAVWHEPDDEPTCLLGLAYPALDPESESLAAETSDYEVRASETRASETRASRTRQDAGSGCVRLPYLSLGSAVRIRNECADRYAVLPVTSDGAAARQFCDRCMICGTSPKGRVADLTMAAFVELGGNLEDGCFNATMTTSL